MIHYCVYYVFLWNRRYMLIFSRGGTSFTLSIDDLRSGPLFKYTICWLLFTKSWWFPHILKVKFNVKCNVIWNLDVMKKFIICWPILYCMVTGHLIQGLLYCSVLVLYVLSHLAVGVFHVHLLDLTLIDGRTILKFCWTACFEIITQSFQNILLWCVALKSKAYIELTFFQVHQNNN